MAPRTGEQRTSREARFEALAADVYEQLQRYARRRVDAAVVDDVVAESLLVLWRRLDDVPAGAELPWSYGVARRVIANQHRSESRSLHLVEKLTATAVQEPPADTDRDGELQEALDHLSEPDRELLHLWAWEQLAPREIAVVLGVSANAVSIRLHRAQRRLRADLEKRKSPAPAGQVRGVGTSREQG